MTEEVGARDGRREGSGRGDMAEGQAAVDLRVAGGLEAHFRIEGAQADVFRRICEGACEGLAQEGCRLGIEVREPVHRSGGIVEGFSSGRVGGLNSGHARGSITGIKSKVRTSTRPRSEIRSSGMTTRASRECCI